MGGGTGIPHERGPAVIRLAWVAYVTTADGRPL